ncbi:U4/U6.U5 tri-snRNP-associated protein 1-like isoform X2 [Corticium candelabrum]|uniref:U4/U6.U5 tri-snRNP-associated protein 1-like isoform X2 n=1 Tax=Corticium candelabrum TaxID=121492 RepID=UPI002E264C20|nr:U4/U6.U5 tri-snRNP-associated protein 1-like isoform X2 [Corticium candelabrum]
MGSSKKKHKDGDDRRKKKSKRDEKRDEGDHVEKHVRADGGDSHERKKKKRKRSRKEAEKDGKELTKDLQSDGESEGGESKKKKQDVHVPAHNIGEKREQEEVKRKLAEMQEKRKIREKLSKVKSLGEGDDEKENESAASWIEKSRRIQRERELAAKREQMMREMDEDVDRENDSDMAKEARPEYSLRDLAGLTVEHSRDTFLEGKAVVLTLKDADVLDEERGDVLYNINLLDNEKAAKNVELKKLKPSYNPYTDDEVDEFGVLKEKKILEKYDEEIDGEKATSFTLGNYGRVSTEDIEEEKRIRESLSLKGESLQHSTGRLASEYYTHEELVQFKKPKKKRKVMRKSLKVDDLVPLEETGKDHGSRQKVSDSKGSEHKKGKRHVAIKQEQNESIEESYMEVDDGFGDVEEDEAEVELQKALQRARRVKSSGKIGGVERVGEMLSKSSEVKQQNETSQPTEQGKIVLSSIAEFCRTVGEKSQDVPERVVSVKHDHQSESEEDMQFEAAEPADESDDDEERRGFEAEPSIGASITAALQMAMRKGMLDSGTTERKYDKKMEFVDRDKAKNVFVESTSEPGIYGESTRDSRRDRDRERDRDRDRDLYSRDRYDSSHSQSSSKEEYKPKVELKYINEKGETMDEKEAFRYLSHKFHGKKPGKSKTEKRVKKKLDDEALKKMHSTDTPLNTVAMMHEKQRQAGSAFLVLSGGARSLAGVSDFGRK